MKQLACIILALALLLALTACGAPKQVHCDSCGEIIDLDPKSNIEEDWIVFCKKCENELFPDGLIS